MAEQCEMIIGFLVPHRCEKPALGHCAKCGRGFCDEHLLSEAGGQICVACQQGLSQPVALPITARSFTAEDILLFNAVNTPDFADESRSDLFSDLS
jgi:hypothetical protein